MGSGRKGGRDGHPPGNLQPLAAVNSRPEDPVAGEFATLCDARVAENWPISLKN